MERTRPGLFRQVNRNAGRLWALNTVPQNIYIAASINAQNDAVRLALELVLAGFKVTSRWLRIDHEKLSPLTKNDERQQWLARQEEWAHKDLEDLEAADTLVILTDTPSSKGGYHVVGSSLPNVFYYSDHVRNVPEVQGLLAFLQSPEHGPQVEAVGPLEPVNFLGEKESNVGF